MLRAPTMFEKQLEKTRFFKYVQTVCYVAAVLISGTRICRADWPPGRHMAESMAINLVLGSAIEQNSDYGFCDTCYLGAFIKPGNDSFLTLQLDSGGEYKFVGAVQKTCDLDIIIEDTNGNVVARDTRVDSVPIVDFAPTSSEQYTVRLKLHSARQSQFCGMVLLRKGGWAVKVSNLGTATTNVLTHCEAIAGQAIAKFCEVPGEWAMIGQVMREGGTNTFSGIRLGTGRRVVTAGGDANSKDIDLLVTREGAVPVRLASDTQRDSFPIVEFRTSVASTYILETQNARSHGPSIVMTAILEIE